MRDDRRPPERVPPEKGARARSGVFGGRGVPEDPYLEWNRATDYAYLPGPQDRKLPILIKLRRGLTARQFATGHWGDDAEPPADLEDWFTIPDIFRTLPDWLAPLQYCTADVSRDSIHRLLDPESVFASVIEQFELSDPVGQTEVPFVTTQQQLSTGWTPSVIVGVIDDGLPFANARFRVTNITTRVEYLWDQDGSTDLSKAAIDYYLYKSLHAGLVDEDEVYRRAGYSYGVSRHKSWARRATHGAHVMDLACGLDPKEVVVDSPRIIGVDLPTRITADPSSGQLGLYVFLALLYILIRADQVAAQYGSGPLPVVVNLSYGINHGPHDGTSLLERLIDALTLLRHAVSPFTLVLAAGNSHLTRCHAHFKVNPGALQARSLEWRVQPDDATPTLLEVWLPYDAGAAQIEVEIETPDHRRLGPLKAGDPPLLWPSSPPTLLRVSYPAVPAFGKRNVISFWLAPTTSLDSSVAPSGTWRIKVTNVGATARWIDSWIWRDEAPFGYPIRGRQSRFDDAQYERFASKGHLSEVDVGPSYIKRDSSINGMATGSETVVIGGCRRSDLAPARYSAGGPTLKPSAWRWPPRIGPDATAYAEWSVACHGMLATGTRSRSVVAVNGTSVSAPQVTRWIADNMAAGGQGGRPEVAAEGALYPTPKIPPKRGNYGYVDPGYSRSPIDRGVPL